MSRSHDACFILKTQAHRNTSLIVECFSQNFGRFPLLARGARRPRSEIRGQLSLFAPLKIHFSGKNDIKMLHQVDWLGGLPQLTGEAILAGFYLNELLLKLLARDDPFEHLFLTYAKTMAHLAHLGLEDGKILRLFEWKLLTTLGIAPSLEHDDNGRTIDAQAFYLFRHHRPHPSRVPYVGQATGQLIRGQSLIALQQLEHISPSSEDLRQIRQLLRLLLDRELHFHPLVSREVLHATRYFERKTS